jgi:hypothetical protein
MELTYHWIAIESQGQREILLNFRKLALERENGKIFWISENLILTGTLRSHLPRSHAL